jgi:hypothetical protein
VIDRKLLGWIVIAYAVLTSGTVLELLRVLPWRQFRLDITSNGVLWAYLLLGGIGLVLHRPWSKWLVMFASGGSLAAVAIRLAVLRHVESVAAHTRFLVWTVISGLPFLLFLLAAITLKTPRAEPATASAVRQPDPVATRKRWRSDIAYASHISIVLMASIMYFVELLGKARIIDSSAYQGWLTFVGISFAVPIAIAMVVAVALGIVSLFIRPKDWRLPFLSGLIVLFVAVFIWEEQRPAPEVWVHYVAVAYIAVAALLVVRWYLFARRGVV